MSKSLPRPAKLPWNPEKITRELPYTRSKHRQPLPGSSTVDLKIKIVKIKQDYQKRIIRSLEQEKRLDAEIREILSEPASLHREVFLTEKLELLAAHRDVRERYERLLDAAERYDE